jgi:LuxR family transcriptional regulator
VELCARPGLSPEDVAGIWSRRGQEIELMCNLAHLKISHLPSWAGRRPLTDKQRRVLHWASEGKTAQETAIILGLSAATVEKHLRLARETLDVQTTAQAIAKAAPWNQLFIEDDLDAA